jgi:hypothetical protein
MEPHWRNGKMPAHNKTDASRMARDALEHDGKT